MDTMQNLRRTCYCGEVTEAGKTVVVGGFVQKVRILGNLKRLLDATANMSCWQKGKPSHVPASTPI